MTANVTIVEDDLGVVIERKSEGFAMEDPRKRYRDRRYFSHQARDLLIIGLLIRRPTILTDNVSISDVAIILLPIYGLRGRIGNGADDYVTSCLSPREICNPQRMVPRQRSRV